MIIYLEQIKNIVEFPRESYVPLGCIIEGITSEKELINKKLGCLSQEYNFRDIGKSLITIAIFSEEILFEIIEKTELIINADIKMKLDYIKMMKYYSLGIQAAIMLLFIGFGWITLILNLEKKVTIMFYRSFPILRTL